MSLMTRVPKGFLNFVGGIATEIIAVNSLNYSKKFTLIIVPFQISPPLAIIKKKKMHAFMMFLIPNPNLSH